MTLEVQFQISAQLVIAALLSGVIGIDRERRKIHSAGVRTHMIVGVGSCLFTALSVHAFPGGDTGRVAAQIVSGIGFLGAGVIVFLDREVKNITTAATIWATAAIGMAMGTGSWLLAINTTLIIWFVMVYLRPYIKAPNNNASSESKFYQDAQSGKKKQI